MTFAEQFSYVLGDGSSPVGVSEVTSTVMVQETSPSSRTPSVTVMVPPPGSAAVVAWQVPPVFAGSATTSPSGRSSVNPHPALAESSEVLVTVNVSVEVPFTGTEVGEKALSSCGVTSIRRMLSMPWSLPWPLPVWLRMTMLRSTSGGTSWDPLE